MTAQIYETELYVVVQDLEPEVINGEPMNWLIINKQYGTTEATVSSVPAALMIADELDIRLRQHNKPAPEGATVN